jgi:hypothetical protein
MRIALVAALILATGPALAQTPDTSRDRRVATNSQPADCMALWDPTTHMSKQDWARSCERVQGRLKEIRQIEGRTSRPPTGNKNAP